MPSARQQSLESSHDKSHSGAHDNAPGTMFKEAVVSRAKYRCADLGHEIAASSNDAQ